MQTMIWKELRENLKWAILALIGLLLAEFYTLGALRESDAPPYYGLTICYNSFLMVTAFGSIAIAAALGVVQILPELRRDQWAALLHRPVSRSTIFFGKALAGLLLYFGATLIPFLAAIAFVVTPGQFAAPFSPGMVLPGLSDICFGPAAYFAAMLLCLHRERWWGSRGVLALSFLPLFVIHLIIACPFLYSILAAGIFLLAAWGTLLGDGSAQNRPRTARIASGILILIGAQFFCLVLVGCLQFLPHGTSPGSSTTTRFLVTRDGPILLSTQRSDGSTPVVTDLNGKVVTDERYVGNNASDNFYQLLPVAYIDFFSTADEFLSGDARSSYPYVSYILQTSSSKEFWYTLIRDRYMIGYDKLSRKCIGYFDAEGFKKPGAALKPFPEAIQTFEYSDVAPRLFWCGSQLYGINFSDRTMTPVFYSGSDKIYGASKLDYEPETSTARHIIVVLESGIRVLDMNGAVQQSFPHRYDIHQWAEIMAGASAKFDRFYLKYSPNPWLDRPAPGQNSTYLEEIDLPSNAQHSYSHTEEAVIVVPSWIDRVNSAVSALLPALGAAIYHHFSPHAAPIIFDQSVMTMSTGGELKLADFSLSVPFSLVLGIVALLWGRRMGFSTRRASLWAFFVVCFGLPGMLAFRLIADWPTRVRCPDCGGRRAIAATSCPSCKNPWPAPALTGTEIFGPVTKLT